MVIKENANCHWKGSRTSSSVLVVSPVLVPEHGSLEPLLSDFRGLSVHRQKLAEEKLLYIAVWLST